MPRKKRRMKGAHGDGSVYPLSNGRWGFSLQLNGKRKQGTRKTEAEATLALAALKEGAVALVLSSSEPVTLKAFIEAWLKKSVKPPFYAENSCVNYRQMANRHIYPHFGDEKLMKAVTKADAQDMVYSLAEKAAKRTGKPLATRTIGNVITVLSGAYAAALADPKTGIASNPAAGLKIPKTPPPDIRPFTDDQSLAFLAACRPRANSLAFLLAFVLGARKTEILTLERGDFNLRDRRLHIRGSKTRGSNRHIPLPARLVPVLSAHFDALDRRREEAEEWRGGDRLFLRDDTSPIAPRTFYNHYLSTLAEAGLPEEPFHNTRHTCATLRLLTGENILSVSKLLGHSKPSFTYDTYAHFLEGHAHLTIKSIEDLIAPFEE